MKELLERSVGAEVRLIYDLTPDAWPVMADANQVQTALLNLAINARDAMPDGGTLRIATGNAVHPRSRGGTAGRATMRALASRTPAPACPEEVRARLFEPFFTTKDIGKGTGLGLAQVYGFVRQSGGSVRVHSVVGEGTTFTILLPRRVASADEAAV